MAFSKIPLSTRQLAEGVTKDNTKIKRESLSRFPPKRGWVGGSVQNFPRLQSLSLTLLRPRLLILKLSPVVLPLVSSGHPHDLEQLRSFSKSVQYVG
jgi:hypothetical protein